LEILHRLPPNDLLRNHLKAILATAFKLNVIISLRILIELHKQFRPQYTQDIQRFLVFIKTCYSELPGHMDKIFEPKSPIKIKDINDVNVSSTLDEIYAVTSFQSDKKAPDGNVISV